VRCAVRCVVRDSVMPAGRARGSAYARLVRLPGVWLVQVMDQIHHPR
jgi:hypothetical protein